MDLVVLEEIKRLKYRYLRGVDLKLWDEVADTFTVDATADYGTRATGSEGKQFEGRDAIVEFLTQSLGNGIITVHHAAQPEIDVDGDTATGRWSFTDKVIVPEHKMIVEGAAFYEDTYRRESDGVWRISHIGYVRTYETLTTFDSIPGFKLIANRWAVPA